MIDSDSTAHLIDREAQLLQCGWVVQIQPVSEKEESIRKAKDAPSAARRQAVMRGLHCGMLYGPQGKGAPYTQRLLVPHDCNTPRRLDTSTLSIPS